MRIAEWKKAIWKGYMLHDSNYNDVTEKVKLQRQKKENWLLQVKEEGEMNKQNITDF